MLWSTVTCFSDLNISSQIILSCASLYNIIFKFVERKTLLHLWTSISVSPTWRRIYQTSSEGHRTSCVQSPRLTHVDLSLGWNSATGKELTHFYGKRPLGWEIIPPALRPFSMNFQDMHEVKELLGFPKECKYLYYSIVVWLWGDVHEKVGHVPLLESSVSGSPISNWLGTGTEAQISELIVMRNMIISERIQWKLCIKCLLMSLFVGKKRPYSSLCWYVFLV